MFNNTISAHGDNRDWLKTQLLNQSENTNGHGFPPVIWDGGKAYTFKCITTKNLTKTVLARKLCADGTIRTVRKTVDLYWEIKAQYVEKHSFHRPMTLNVTRAEAYKLGHIPAPSRTCRLGA